MEADHVHNHSEPWNIRKARRSKGPTQAKRHLGDPSPSSIVEAHQGSCIIQLGN